jgi:hypothetical protein
MPKQHSQPTREYTALTKSCTATSRHQISTYDKKLIIRDPFEQAAAVEPARIAIASNDLATAAQ